MHHPQMQIGRSEAIGALTSGNSRGTAITSSSSGSGFEGNWTDVGSPTNFAYEAITVSIFRASAGQHLIDLAISDGSDRFIIAENLHLDGHLISEFGFQTYIPLHIPAGAQLSARNQSSGSSLAADILITGHETGLGGAPGFSRCVALYTDTGSGSRLGQAIDPGGTANTKGAWAEMTASCPNDIAAMFGLIGHNGDVSRAVGAAALIDIGVGSAGNEFVVYPNARVGWSTARDGPSICPRIPLFAADVPSGTRIAARAACSINTAGDRTVDLALYGLVK